MPLNMPTSLTIPLVVAALMLAGAMRLGAQSQPPPVTKMTNAIAGDDNGSDTNDAKAAELELAKKLQNPVANLVSVPIQNNWDFGIGQNNAMRYTVNIQPVTPFSISTDWNLIIRTILPVIYADPISNNPMAPANARDSHYGLGDVTQSFFLSPKNKLGGWILGAGPVALWPTATDSVLGSGKWGAGPTAVALRQEHGFTYGILANHIWSYAGWGPQNVNATFLQPFISYTTKTYTTFAVNTESTYNWQASQWTVPLNFSVQQLIKIGNQPIAFQFGYRYYAQRPSGGPDWGLRFSVTFLFPK
jgi:hypothetical protein